MYPRTENALARGGVLGMGRESRDGGEPLSFLLAQEMGTVLRQPNLAEPSQTHLVVVLGR